MSSPTLHAEIQELLFRDALYLDTHEWDAWLALYDQDCEFWMPAWLDEVTPTSDPESQLSLIYYAGRRNLEDRIWRVKSGASVASSPLPRVVHAVTNILVDDGEEGLVAAKASFTVHLFDVRSGRSHVFFGRYEYRLRRSEDGWRIARKKIYLLNDVIPTVVDFYSI